MQKKISAMYTALVGGGTVSLAVLDTAALVNEAISRHRLSPLAANALGRALTAGAYLCGWLKTEGSVLSLSVDGGGAGGRLGVSGDAALHMRGFIGNPSVSLPLRADGKDDVGGCVGRDGTFTVVRDDGERLPFTGTCALVSGEISDDLSAYFLASEQRHVSLSLGVLIGGKGDCLAAGGIFFQSLPGAGEEAVRFCERELSRFKDIPSLIEERGGAAIVEEYGEKPFVREISFRCRCSRERAADAVRAMGRTEALETARSEGGVKVNCRDCNTDYIFTEEDVLRLFGE